MSHKTKYLIFTRKYSLLSPLKYHKINCNINYCVCQPIEYIKYLGLWVDSKLKWNIHINYL